MNFVMPNKFRNFAGSEVIRKLELRIMNYEGD